MCGKDSPIIKSFIDIAKFNSYDADRRCGSLPGPGQLLQRPQPSSGLYK